MDQSFNDLKFQLQNELQKDGTVENMKTQLRYKLLEKLQFQQKKIPNSERISETDMLLKRVLASLVADYLKDNRMEYCLSVFLPESTFGNAILNRDELKLVLKQEQSACSILQGMIQDLLLLKPKEALKANAGTQTYTGDAIVNLEQRLSQVDSQYKSKIEGELMIPYMNMEERLQKLKKEYDQRLKAELAAEVTRIREFEIQNFKLEESEKTRGKMQAYREELEKQYQDKLNKLRERERDALDKAQSKMKELESLNYNYRQKIIKEHDFIKLKEEELEKQKGSVDEQQKLTKQRLEILERDVEKKAKGLVEQEMSFKRQLEQAVNAARIDAENQFNAEKESYKENMKNLEKDKQKLHQLQMTMTQLQKENKQLSTENQDYVENIREMKKNSKSIELDYAELKEHIRSLSDAQRREQELSRKYEQELRLKEDEIQLLKTTVSHKEGMINDHKVLHQEGTKKLQKELEACQAKIEMQELLIKDLQIMKENHNPNYDIESALFKHNVVDSTLMHYNIADHKKRMDQIQKELNDNRNMRKEEIKRLQEDALVPIKDQQLKFDNVWDHYNSSVNFQEPSQYRDKDPIKIFQAGEDAQSQIMQSSVFQGQKKQPTNNIIDETYQELL